MGNGRDGSCVAGLTVATEFEAGWQRTCITAIRIDQEDRLGDRDPQTAHRMAGTSCRLLAGRDPTSITAVSKPRGDTVCSGRSKRHRSHPWRGWSRCRQIPDRCRRHSIISMCQISWRASRWPGDHPSQAGRRTSAARLDSADHHLMGPVRPPAATRPRRSPSNWSGGTRRACARRWAVGLHPFQLVLDAPILLHRLRAHRGLAGESPAV